MEQIRQIFAKNKLKVDSAAARFLCQIANLPDTGGLRICRNLVEYATDMADWKHVSVIDVDLIRGAMKCSLMVGRADRLLNQVEEVQHRFERQASAAG